MIWSFPRRDLVGWKRKLLLALAVNSDWLRPWFMERVWALCDSPILTPFALRLSWMGVELADIAATIGRAFVPVVDAAAVAMNELAAQLHPLAGVGGYEIEEGYEG